MVSFTLHGIPVAQGIAIGRAHLLTPAVMDVQHYLVDDDKVEAEVLRLKTAFDVVRLELKKIRAELPKDAPPELAAFIDVHELILSDAMLQDDPIETIRSRQYNAEWALVTHIESLSAQFDEIEDPYLRERKADIEQVGERILKALTGSANKVAAPVDAAAGRLIVVAHDISPADMMQFRDDAFDGFVTDLGGQNSHTAIVARSMNIPAAIGMGNASRIIRQDDVIIIDSMAGVVIVNPSPLLLMQYRARREHILQSRTALQRLKTEPAITQDGVTMTLFANIERPKDGVTAMEAGADGIGLFRSEFLFMGREGGLEKLPTEEEQFEAYQQIVVAMQGKPVTIRTLDVGADKPLDTEHAVLNPALGLRAIRFCLGEPQMFLTQLRAILRASACGPVKLLIPMMAHAFEIDQTLALIAQAKAQLRARDVPFDEHIPVGAMIEIPAAALALPMFIKRLDFLSIGTNDLIQYTLAIDRVDSEVAYLYDAVHPAILFLLSTVIRQAKQANIPVSVCGEMAGDVKMTRLLLGMGLTEFSMHPAQLLAVKHEIMQSNKSALVPKVDALLTVTEPEAILEGMAKLSD
jgi:phosphotransferase system enzyme I (PtsI)